MAPGAGYLEQVPGEDRSMAATDLRWPQRYEELVIERSGEVCFRQIRGKRRGAEPLGNDGETSGSPRGKRGSSARARDVSTSRDGGARPRQAV